MNHRSSGNSIIPSEQEHDDHYAHRCECGVIFSKHEPMFDTTAGYLCETCADKYDEENPPEIPEIGHPRFPTVKTFSRFSQLPACTFPRAAYIPTLPFGPAASH